MHTQDLEITIDKLNGGKSTFTLYMCRYVF